MATRRPKRTHRKHFTRRAEHRAYSALELARFIDGKTYQSLKRHLGTHGLTPDDYRQRYGLPDTYPMVSPAYSAKRSALAREIGLGKGGRKPAKAGRAKSGS